MVAFALSGAVASAQTMVSSFAELRDYLDAVDAHVVMTPGTYRITAADCGSSGSGLFPEAPLLSFTGSNSVFDFTDVIFEIETEVFQRFGSIDVKEIAVFGEDQVLKNLTMIDVGNTRPSKTALGVLLDGSRNRVEGFNMTVRGSQPYGYGDIFGKGSGYVIKHYKHSAILVRGEDNHLLNCKVFHRSYGHGIFCQGSQNAVIEGCYVEGETRTSDDVLAEEGSGSAADEKDFVTNWGEDENGENGYRLQPGWMFSLHEDGIRAYNTGPGLDGETVNTRNLRVVDCTVRNMRSGVTIGFCDNTKYIANSVIQGTENGYWPGSSGQIVDCAGYADHGPILVYNYDNDKNSIVDLTFLGAPDRYGNELVAYIGGSGHNVTLRGRDGVADPNLHVKVGGVRTGIRFHVPNKYSTLSASGVLLYNRNLHRVEMGTNSVGTAGQTAGEITDLGAGNNLAPISLGTSGGFGILQPIEAEAYSAQSGAVVQMTDDGVRCVGVAAEGDWICFEDFFFGSGPNRFEAFVVGGAAAGSVEIRLNGVDGELVGTCPVAAGDGTWVAETIELDEPRGKNDVYLVFKGTACAMPRLDRFRFYVDFPGRVDSKGLVGHWKFDEGAGAVAKDSSGYGHHGAITAAAWAAGKKHGALEFDGGASSVRVPAAAFDTIIDEVTIAMWVYGDAAQPLNGSVFYAVDSGGNRELNIHLPWGDNSTVYWDAGNESGYDRINKAASAAEYKGQWNHWTFTKNAQTGNMRIYLNGALWHAGADERNVIEDISAAAIGSQIGGAASYSGRIDEVRLYDTELLEHEVAELYDSYSFADGGAPHAWLDAHGLVDGDDYEAAARGDADGDGMSNSSEFHAGTNPTNSASVLRVVGGVPEGGEVVVGWPAVAGKRYDVWVKPELAADAWTLYESDIPAVEPSCVSTVRTANATGFLRVDTVP